MRAPRYRFPEEVRATTRAMASRMVREGTIPETPEQLEGWIAGDAESRLPLERGGYGTAFGAHDLLPLLQVFIVQAGGPAPPVADAAPTASRPAWLGGAALALAILAVVFILVLVL